MDKNEHTVDSQQMKMNQGGPMGKGPAGGKGAGEKANNFKKTIRQLVSYSKAYVPMIVLAMVLALVGSTLNVIGPDKLSDIANLIQEGIVTGIDVSAVRRLFCIGAFIWIWSYL